MSISGILRNLDLRMLFDQFLSMVREQYWLSVLLLLTVLVLLTLYLVVVVGSVVAHLGVLWRRLNHWYILIPVVAGICVLFGLSAATVAFLKTMPVPNLAGINPTISQ